MRRKKTTPKLTGIAGERIGMLCHAVNSVFNELPWFRTPLQELRWAVQAALLATDLPESWITAAGTRRMIVEYKQSFLVTGRCLNPADLVAIEKRMRE